MWSPLVDSGFRSDVDQGAEAVQLPRPTLSAEARGLQLSSGGPRFTETVQVDVGIRTGFVSQVRAAASSNRTTPMRRSTHLRHYVNRPAGANVRKRTDGRCRSARRFG